MCAKYGRVDGLYVYDGLGEDLVCVFELRGPLNGCAIKLAAVSRCILHERFYEELNIFWGLELFWLRR